MAAPRGRRDLARVLIQRGVITEQQAREALERQASDRSQKLERVIADAGFAPAIEVYGVLAELLDVPLADFDNLDIDEDVVNLVPHDVIERVNAIPVKRAPDGGLVFVMAEPDEIEHIDELRRRAGVSVTPMLGVPQQIEELRGRIYGAVASTTDETDTAFAEIAATRAASGAGAHTAGIGMVADISALKGSDEDAANTAPIIRIVNTLLKQAIKMGASDVHIEPQRGNVRIRYRVDGDLREIMTPPKHVHAPLISRMKIMADMDIAEKRVPQDGRVGVRMDGRVFDLRVSTIPTANGEKCVFRILDQGSVMIGLEKLGFFAEIQSQLERLIVQPNGILLSTGPTGHGKTTTQYSILNKINSIEKNIITIEDPVEYQLPGISQVPVNRKAGLTFANALRSFLRQDPDIIMVGEIRDLETADIAIEASLTGHLVLSTLHTNNAPSAVTRLIDMGVEPFLISASVIGVLAQRLVRRICQNCREEYTPPRDLMLGFGWDPDNPPDPEQKFYHGRGCEQCGHTGFRGRVGIFELFEMNGELAELIVRRAPLSEIDEAARANGMKTLREDGFAKICNGTTTVEELVRKVRTAGVY